MNFGDVNNYFLFTQEELIKLKTNITKEEITYLEDTLKDCLKDYEKEKKSVIYTKDGYPNVEKNDYVSLSPYWWPDPQKEDGLPYIRRDGEVNPEYHMYDQSNFKQLGFDTYHLCLLYYLTGNKIYYDTLKKDIYYYFLDKVTGMNPHMEHAQTVRGQDNGRCYGIIEYNTGIVLSFDFINTLHKMGLIEDEFKNDMNVWIKDFLTWMTTSQMGIKERDGNNNHAIYWDFGTVVLYDFLSDDSKMQEMYDRALLFRVKAQISEEGSMPFELARTRSIHYSIMALKGIFNFSLIAKKYGYDLWENVEAKEILTSATNYLYDRLIFKTKPWVYKQITSADSTFMLSLMNQAYINLGDKYNRFDLIDKELVENEVAYLLGKIILN